MSLRLQVLILIALSVLGALLNIWAVGRPRPPITGGNAVWVALFTVLEIWVLLTVLRGMQ